MGGTRFLGVHVVEELLRAGHEVTLFHRGSRTPNWERPVDHVWVTATSPPDLAQLTRLTFDAVLDLSAYTRAQTALLLRGAARRAAVGAHLDRERLPARSHCCPGPRTRLTGRTRCGVPTRWRRSAASWRCASGVPAPLSTSGHPAAAGARARQLHRPGGVRAQPAARRRADPAPRRRPGRPPVRLDPPRRARARPRGRARRRGLPRLQRRLPPLRHLAGGIRAGVRRGVRDDSPPAHRRRRRRPARTWRSSTAWTACSRSATRTPSPTCPRPTRPDCSNRFSRCTT